MTAWSGGNPSLRRAPQIFAAWAALATATFAQTQPVPEQTVFFTVFSARPATGLAFAPRMDASPQSLVFYPTTRSPRYAFRGPMPLRFYDVKIGAVVAEVRVPPDITDALLLFAPMPAAAGSALRYQVSVLNDGAARHGPGGLVVINFSGLALGGTIDGRTVELTDGLNPVLSIGRTARIMLRTKFKQRSYQSYAGTVELKKNERALLILFPPFNRGSVEVQSRLLMDEPLVPVQPEAAGHNSGVR